MSRPNSALFLSAILSRHSDEHRHLWRAGCSEQSNRLRRASQPLTSRRDSGLRCSGQCDRDARARGRVRRVVSFSAPHLNTLSSDPRDSRIWLEVCLVEYHVAQLALVHSLTAFYTTVEVAVSSCPLGDFHFSKFVHSIGGDKSLFPIPKTG